MKPPPDPRFERARMGLILDAPFFGSLIVRLPVIEDDKVPTFQTNGKRILYNRAYANTLTDAELRYVFCHEIMHCSMGHLWRMAGRDAETWNKACDYVVNQMLDDYAAGVQGRVPWSRPKDVLDVADAPQYRGLAPEEIYRMMRDDQQQKQPPPPQPGPSDEQGGEPENGDGPPESGKGPPEKADGPPDANAKAEPGDGGIGDFEAPPPDDDPQPGAEAGAESGLEEDWEIATVQAERIANMKGNCPGAASHLVNEMKAPKVSWRDVLREFIRQNAKNDWSFRRPNRRHLARGFVLPSLHSERMGRLVAAFDSSGSTRRFVADFQAEVQAALDECQPERIDVIVCDAKVQCVQSFEPGDVVTIDAKGGGGTDFRPVFDIIEDPPRRRGFGNREGRPGEQEAKEHGLEEFDEPPVCMVYLTDLDGSFPAKEPEYPVLWCVPPGVSVSRKVPFGEIVAVK
jgi:predicted metal-dependent peptidase